MTVDLDVLFKFVELLLLPFAWHIIKRLDALAETSTTLASDSRELKTILIGTDGKNGIRSRVMRLERRVENLSIRQASRHGEEIPLENLDTEDL